MAAKTWPAIKALLNAAADAGDAIHQVLFGTSSAAKVFYPETPENYEGAKPHTRGQAIAVDTTLEYLMNNGLAAFLDTHSICWAVVATNATGVTPTVTEGYGVSSASKNEGNKTVQLTFDTAYANTSFFVTGALDAYDSVHHFHGASTTTVTLAFHDVNSGLDIAINSQTVRILVVGAR
jgi:hypothetical protein